MCSLASQTDHYSANHKKGCAVRRERNVTRIKSIVEAEIGISRRIKSESACDGINVVRLYYGNIVTREGREEGFTKDRYVVISAH